MSRRLLLQQFARLPRVGRVKTRLQPALSAQGAYNIHKQLMLSTARRLVETSIPAELWLDELGDCSTCAEIIAMGMRGPKLQHGGDLGERMLHALADGLRRADQVVLVGSDCPDLDTPYLEQAFEALEQHEFVLGPAEDGGFVLIGCARPAAISRLLDDCSQAIASSFSGIEWGGSRALAGVRRCLDLRGHSYHLLEQRYDVDRPEDVHRWERSQVGQVEDPFAEEESRERRVQA